MSIHTLFDISCALWSLGLTFAVYRWRLSALAHPVIREGRTGYAVAVVVGAAIGGYGFGTLNLWLTGLPGIGRSILGALAAAVAAVELYKAATGVRGSTGLVFVIAFSVTVAWGRLGCFYAGLGDQTHGIATTLPWAVDLGDGIARHPVQIYESPSMAAFLTCALVALGQRNGYFVRNGFYLMVGFYAAQRFVWEFLKPYATVAGPFNLFHLMCAALLAYALFMIRRRHVRP